MYNIFLQSDRITSCMNKFLNLIPKSMDPERKLSKSYFTRNRELPFPKLITFILSITASGKSKGVDTKSADLSRNARRSGLWPDVRAVHRSSVTKARKKIPWEVFRDLLGKAVEIAQDLWPQWRQYLWHGMSVYATDGSKYNLPATEENRQEFDPQSGLQSSGKGHYPQCLVSTLYDVFRHLPIARTITGLHGSEREEVKNLLPFVPPGNVWIFDRGYPSYELILYLINHFRGYFIFRAPASGTFPAVEEFIRSGKEEDVIWITPSNKYMRTIKIKERKNRKLIKLRIIRLVSPDGTISVLLTSLHNKKEFPATEIIALYFKRWEIESYYRDEKSVLEIEKFHSKTPNSIRQELFAVMVMSVIARTLMVISQEESFSEFQEVQFKNAIMNLASEVAVLVSEDPEKAVQIFKELIQEIARVKYYRKKGPRPSQPRVTKKPLNKWCSRKSKKIAYA